MFCPSCGKPNAEGAKFCAHCGKPMPQRSAQPEPRQSEPVRQQPAPTQSTSIPQPQPMPAQQSASQSTAAASQSAPMWQQQPVPPQQPSQPQPTPAAQQSVPQTSIPLPNQSGTPQAAPAQQAQQTQSEQKPANQFLTALRNAPRGMVVTVVVVAALAIGSLAMHGFGSSSNQASSEQTSSSSSTGSQSDGSNGSSDESQQENSPVSISNVSYSKSYYWDTSPSKQDCYVVSMTVSSNQALTVAPTIRVDYSSIDKYGDAQNHVAVLGGNVTKYASLEDDNSSVGGFQIFSNTAGGTSNFSIGANTQRKVDFYINYDADAVTDVSKISVIDSQYSEDSSSSEGTLDENALSQIKLEKQTDDNGRSSLTGTVENTTNDKWPSAEVSVMFTIDGRPVAGGSGFMVSGKVDKPLKPGVSGTCTIEQPLTDEEVAKTGGTLAWQVASVTYDIDSE